MSLYTEAAMTHGSDANRLVRSVESDGMVWCGKCEFI